MEDEIMDLLILSDFTFKEVADRFEISVAEVKRIFKEYNDIISEWGKVASPRYNRRLLEVGVTEPCTRMSNV
tara:strand:+ start:160 stop:375 length:216 start_codon:yes stop_codon:yes gene_type:complete